MVPSLTFATQQFNIGRAPQTKTPLHLRTMFAAGSLLHCSIADRSSAVPIHALDVVVHLHAHRTTAFLAAIFQHSTTALRSHSFSKAMYPHTTAYFWLICTFRHVLHSPKKTRAYSPLEFSFSRSWGALYFTRTLIARPLLYYKGESRLYMTTGACQIASIKQYLKITG